LSDDGRVAFPDWFAGTGARENFEVILSPYKNQPNLNFLQLGAYTGDATVWLLDNIITHETAKLIDVDTWEGSDEDEHDKLDFNAVYELYLSRTKKYNQLQFHKKKTLDYLRYEKENFDFIYIDADHTAIGVLLDAELSWDLLKPGGIMAFDDYEWRSGRGGEFDPAPGINSFLTRHQGEFLVIHKGWQVWIVKK
jgi:predicted O-methyltransferase YrrM